MLLIQNFRIRATPCFLRTCFRLPANQAGRGPGICLYRHRFVILKPYTTTCIGDTTSFIAKQAHTCLTLPGQPCMPQQAAHLDPINFRARHTAIAVNALQTASICDVQQHSCKVVQPDTNRWIKLGVYKFCASRGVDAGSPPIKKHNQHRHRPSVARQWHAVPAFEPFRGLQNEQRHEVHRMQN